ncbi:hypothetical protein Tco_0462494 [Tanacetum coccineum]
MELMTPDLACPSTHQLLRSSSGSSGPDVSFDKSASPEHFFGISPCCHNGRFVISMDFEVSDDSFFPDKGHLPIHKLLHSFGGWYLINHHRGYRSQDMLGLSMNSDSKLFLIQSLMVPPTFDPTSYIGVVGVASRTQDKATKDVMSLNISKTMVLNFEMYVFRVEIPSAISVRLFSTTLSL